MMNFSEAIIASVSATVLSGIGVAMRLMWNALKADHRRLEQQAAVCLADRTALHVEVAELRGILHAALMCGETGCPVRAALAAHLQQRIRHETPGPVPKNPAR